MNFSYNIITKLQTVAHFLSKRTSKSSGILIFSSIPSVAVQDFVFSLQLAPFPSRLSRGDQILALPLSSSIPNNCLFS